MQAEDDLKVGQAGELWDMTLTVDCDEQETRKRQRGTEQFLKYIATHVEEFRAKRSRVLHLLGSNSGAWAPSGYYHEELLRSFLRAALPGLCSVNHGYIYGFGQENSRQIDVLVWDAVNYAPVFKEGDLCIVVPESVIATIEVSSSRQVKEKLKRDLEKLDCVADLESTFREPLTSGDEKTYSPIIKAGVYFPNDASVQDIQDVLSAHYDGWPVERKQRLKTDLKAEQHPILRGHWFRHVVQGIYCFTEENEVAVELWGPANTGPFSYEVKTEVRNGLSRILQNIFWAISRRNPHMIGWTWLAALNYIDPVTGAIGGDVSMFSENSQRKLIESWTT